MKKYVITGGASFGKTTVLNILRERGYEIVPEAADFIIREERELGIGDTMKRKDVYGFQLKVAERQIELENNIQGEIVFLDRGIIDGVAYCQYGNVEIPKIVTENAANRYDKIFVLESLNKFELDGIRTSNLEEATKIHELIKKAYQSFGYELIAVPALPPEERADFILATL